MEYCGEFYGDYSLRPRLMSVQAGISCKWTDDSQRFLLEHFDAIYNSPPQIYHSAHPHLGFASAMLWSSHKR